MLRGPAPHSSERRRLNDKVCGICGVAFVTRSTEAEARVRAMAGAMGHRGPDEEGFLVNDARAPGLALGMRRPSIIDLAGEAAPLSYETNAVPAGMNGALYNYREVPVCL